MTTPTPPNPELAALPDLFLLNPNNRAFIDGKKRSIAGGVPLTETLLVLLIVLVFLVWAFSQLSLALELTNSGIVTEGRITRLWEVSDGDSFTRYVSFTFMAEDQLYSAQQSVDVSAYQSLEQGMSTQVIYASSNPRNVSLYSRLPMPGGRIAAIIGFSGAFLAIVGVVFLLRRRVYRLSKGQLFEGKVTSWRTEEVEDSEGNKSIVGCLDYSFVTSEGRLYLPKVTKNFSFRDYHRLLSQQRDTPKSGTPIAVLYVDDKLYEVL